jgi:predicted RNA-binding protein with TRAM domain
MRLKTGFRIAVMAAFAWSLVGCGGGGDTQPQVAERKWSTPIASGITARVPLGVFSDGGDGVFVVVIDRAGGITVQRFATATGWETPTVNFVGLESLQAVATAGGVTIFGRDANDWVQRTYTATGAQPIRTAFPVDLPDGMTNPPVEVQFSRTFEGNILAVSNVNKDVQAVVRTREYREGFGWSIASDAGLLNARGDGLVLAFGTTVSVTRTREGDVATVSASRTALSSFVALRKLNEDVFRTVYSRSPRLSALILGLRHASLLAALRLLTYKKTARQRAEQ